MEDLFINNKHTHDQNEEQEEVDLSEHGIEEDDVRFILIAERVEILSQLWRDNRAKPGQEPNKQNYDRFYYLRTITMILIIF